MHSVWEKNKRFCTVVDLPTYILASPFAPLIFAGFPNHSALLTMVSQRASLTGKFKTTTATGTRLNERCHALNNGCARAVLFLVYFLAFHCKTTTWYDQILQWWLIFELSVSILTLCYVLTNLSSRCLDNPIIHCLNLKYYVINLKTSTLSVDELQKFSSRKS